MARYELHTHTYYSDGRASPEAVLRHAAGLGLGGIAITDHDNANGARAAGPLAAELGLELIPAIEFTAALDAIDTSGQSDPDLDILGYVVDLDDPGFRAMEAAALADLAERVADCCARLTAAGYPLTIEEVVAQNPRYQGALHVIEALRARGYAERWSDAFQLCDAHWRRVRLTRHRVERIIEVIHRAGGVAVLAHPGRMRAGGALLGVEHFRALAAMGLDGVEAHYPRHDAAMEAHFLDAAARCDLLVTAGSDEHGWRAGFPRLGSQPASPEMVEALRARAAVSRQPSAVGEGAGPSRASAKG